MKIEDLTLTPLSAQDELAFTRNMARVLARVLPDIGEREAAAGLARNCVTVFCATRGQLPEVQTPEGLLYHLTLEEIAELARRYAQNKGGWCQNESYGRGRQA